MMQTVLTKEQTILPSGCGRDAKMRMSSLMEVYRIGETIDGVFYDEIIAEINNDGSYSEYDNTAELANIINKEGDISEK